MRRLGDEPALPGQRLAERGDGALTEQGSDQGSGGDADAFSDAERSQQPVPLLLLTGQVVRGL